MAYGLLDVIKNEALGQANHVNRAVYSERLTICQTCPNLLKNPLGGNCKLCGCFVKVKAKYQESQCPDDPPKWFAE